MTEFNLHDWTNISFDEYKEAKEKALMDKHNEKIAEVPA